MLGQTLGVSFPQQNNAKRLYQYSYSPHVRPTSALYISTCGDT